MSDLHRLRVRQLFEEIINQKNEGLLTEVFSPSYQFEELRGPAAARRFLFEKLLVSFPDLHYTVHELLCEGDLVAAVCTAEGTHRGLYQGVPGTGKRMRYREIFVAHLEDGKLRELIYEIDRQKVMLQLGFAVAVPM